MTLNSWRTFFVSFLIARAWSVVLVHSSLQTLLLEVDGVVFTLLVHLFRIDQRSLFA